MQSFIVSRARFHLALVAVCLLVASYLPSWHKLWFVAESGHFGGGTSWIWLLLIGLYKGWRPALGLTYILVALQLVLAGYILSYNIPTGGPTLGFILSSALYVAGGGILYGSPALKQYFGSQPSITRS
jgi:hypothetical protein